MRIAISTQTYYPGNNGQAVFTISLAEGLAQAGHQVMVIAPATPFQPKPIIAGNLQIQTVAAFPLTCFHPDLHITPLPNIKINTLLASFQPDIVHIQDHHWVCESVERAARAWGWPVIGTNHFLPDNITYNLAPLSWNPRYFNDLLWRMMLRIFNRLDLVTTPTRTAAKILQQQNIYTPVVPVSCGVDTDRFFPDTRRDRMATRLRYGLNPTQAMMLYVGRIDQEKRLEVLLRAMHQLRDEALQLAIVGRGSHLSALQELAQKLRLGPRVIFIGYVPAADLPPLLNSADIFTMPSTAELQSIATLEAMATGKPVLAADALALPELVTNGVNGYLFKPNDPQDAARRIAQLLAERERWKSMGRASLTRARQHSLNNTLRRYEELYTSVAQTKRPPRKHSFFGSARATFR